jgi:hypothetical protein
VSSITIVSDDTTIWSVTYDHHYDDRKTFIVQASEGNASWSKMTKMMGLTSAVGQSQIVLNEQQIIFVSSLWTSLKLIM